MDKVTFFNVKNTKSKVPYSPYNDKSFIFETIDINDNIDFFNVLTSHFILNLPLNVIQRPIRCKRTSAELKPFRKDKFTYFIVDVAIDSEYNKNKVIEYFKDYKVILGESRSFNKYDNFNIKGVLFTEELTFEELKVLFASIQRDISDYGYLNDNSIHITSLSAPILKNNILYNNQSGNRAKKISRNISEFIKEYEIESENIGTTQAFKSINGESISEICLNTFKLLGYIPIKEKPNGSIIFEYQGCQNYFWYNNSPYIMHHPNRLKSVNIFNIVKQNNDLKELMSLDLDYDSLLTYNKGEVYKFSEKLMQVQGKEDIIESFLHKRNGLLSIKSPMGTGKSNLIKYIVDECTNYDFKVLIVTNRISVAEDFAKKYDMKLYNKDMYNIGDSLIVQFDSLWKYNINYFDIVIMDEFTSLMLHSRNNMSKNNINLIKFFACFNKKLVIADAFLTGYEFLITEKTENIVNIVNEYRDDIKLTSFIDRNRFISAIVKHAKVAKSEGKSISVSCTSSGTINGLKLLLTEFGMKVVTLTADTPNSNKKIIYKLFEDFKNDKWDVIIYSPTLTVGVSNLNNVEDHFHYDTGNSADVISSLQMIKRSRRARNIHYYVTSKNNYTCTDFNTLRDNYINNYKMDANTNYLYDTDDYGELRLSKIGVKALKIDVFKNILDFNHKKAFEYFLKFHFKNDSYINEEKDDNVINQYIKEYNKYKDDYIRDYNYLTNSDIKNPKILGTINSFCDYLIPMNIEEYNDIVKKITNISLKKSNFIDNVKYFKMLTNNLSKDEIQSKIVYCYANNSNDLNFYTSLLDAKNSNINSLKTYYTANEINNMPKSFKTLILKIGYIYYNNIYKIDKDVQEMSKYFEL